MSSSNNHDRHHEQVRRSRSVNDNNTHEQLSVLNLPSSTASKIAEVALKSFSQVSAKYFPTSNLDEVNSNNKNKPQSSVYAAFVLETCPHREKGDDQKSHHSLFQVVSFGVGTHAVGSSSTISSCAISAESANFCLKDLHAEVLARKGLVSYLLDQADDFLTASLSPSSSLADYNDESCQHYDHPLFEPSSSSKQIRFRSESNKIHLFVTQTPCGECSVFPGARHGARCFVERSVPTKNEEAEKDDDEKDLLRQCYVTTTAPSSLDDTSVDGKTNIINAVLVSSHCNGVDDDDENRTRLKPGKGIRSTSMSCSDKISKWIELGLLGAAAGNIFSVTSSFSSISIPLNSITVQVDTKEEEEETLVRMKRAFYFRHRRVANNNNNTTTTSTQELSLSSSEHFATMTRLGVASGFKRPFPRTSSELSSSTVCLVGNLKEKMIVVKNNSNSENEPPAVSSSFQINQLTGKDGALQGSTPKVREYALIKTLKSGGDEGQSFISSQEHPFCRLALLRKVLGVMKKLRRKDDVTDDCMMMTYADLKAMNKTYALAKERFHGTNRVFSQWVHDRDGKKKEESIRLKDDMKTKVFRMLQPSYFHSNKSTIEKSTTVFFTISLSKYTKTFKNFKKIQKMLFQVPNTPDPSQPLEASIFLAGPCPRDSGVQDWRHECVDLFKQKGFTGALFWPVPNKNEDHGTFNLDKQVAWETKHLKMADIILFWVPRKIEGAFAGFTTNVEFGLYHKSGKCVMGYPPDAEKMRYIEWWCDKIDCLPIAKTLPDLVDLCLKRLTDLGYQKATAQVPSPNNALVSRRGGEQFIPLILWRSQAFQDWYKNQQAQGNKLLWGDVDYVFEIKKCKEKYNFHSAFIAILKAHIQIGKENNRIKDNEVIVFRPDVSAVVPFYVADDENENTAATESHEKQDPLSKMMKNMKVVLTSEFRSPCRNSVGNQVVEPPCGSSWDHVDYSTKSATETAAATVNDRHRKIALEELHEEADIFLTTEAANDRLIYVGSRQVASTLSAHKSHVFAVRLSKEEFEKCVEAERQKKVFGVEEDTERTSIKILSYGDIVASSSDHGLDWSAVGLISQTIMKVCCN